MPNLLADIPKIVKNENCFWHRKNITVWINSCPKEGMVTLSLQEISLLDKEELRQKALAYFRTYYAYPYSSTSATYNLLFGPLTPS